MTTLTAPITARFSSPAGFSTGPGGVRIQNQVSNEIRTVRRVENGRPAHLGGITQSSESISRSGIPLLPFGSTMRSRSSGTGGTFVTITVLPEPEPERPPKERRRR